MCTLVQISAQKVLVQKYSMALRYSRSMNYVPDWRQEFALHKCCLENDIQELRRLLTYEVLEGNLNKQDRRGNTPLHIAVMRGNEEIVEKLLETPKIDVHVMNNELQTPLNEAICYANRKIIKKLMLRGHLQHLKLKNQLERTRFMEMYEPYGDFVLTMTWLFMEPPTNPITFVRPQNFEMIEKRVFTWFKKGINIRLDVKIYTSLRNSDDEVEEILDKEAVFIYNTKSDPERSLCLLDPVTNELMWIPIATVEELEVDKALSSVNRSTQFNTNRLEKSRGNRELLGPLERMMEETNSTIIRVDGLRWRTTKRKEHIGELKKVKVGACTEQNRPQLRNRRPFSLERWQSRRRGRRSTSPTRPARIPQSWSSHASIASGNQLHQKPYQEVASIQRIVVPVENETEERKLNRESSIILDQRVGEGAVGGWHESLRSGGFRDETNIERDYQRPPSAPIVIRGRIQRIVQNAFTGRKSETMTLWELLQDSLETGYSTEDVSATPPNLPRANWAEYKNLNLSKLIGRKSSIETLADQMKLVVLLRKDRHFPLSKSKLRSLVTLFNTLTRNDSKLLDELYAMELRHFPTVFEVTILNRLHAAFSVNNFQWHQNLDASLFDIPVQYSEVHKLTRFTASDFLNIPNVD